MLQYLRRLPLTSIFAMLALVVGVLLGLSVVGTTICFLYQRVGCTAIPTTGLVSSLHTGFQTVCGECAMVPPTLDLNNISSDDIAKLSTTLGSINKKIQDLERRLNYRIDTNHATLESDLHNLKQQQLALSNHLADHVDQADGTVGNVASPLMAKINFFSPWNGVIVNPLQSTPTKEISMKSNTLKQYFKNFFWLTETHYANSPATALTAWHDYGDCWCAADQPKIGELGQDFVRLSLSTNEMIYPSELVVEHVPSAANPTREATPRKIELWADFSHLNDDEWRQLKLDDMQQGNVLGPNWAKVGKMKYDVSRSNHVQTGLLDVNQYELQHTAQHFMVRVTANYGGKNVCLYRVRLHGRPVSAPEAGNTEEWLERMGYRTESD